MMRKSVTIVVTGLAALLTPSAAQAVPVTFRLGGIVNSVSDPDHDLDDLVAAGNTFSGEYTFESSTSELYPGAGYYVSPIGNVAITIGTLQINAGPPRIEVRDAAPPYAEIYTVSAASDSISAPGLQIVEFFPINFYYYGDNALTSSDLPLVPPALPSTSPGLWIQGRGPGGHLFTVAGSVESLTPEPSALFLVAVSVMAIGLGRSRCRRHELRLQAP